MWGDALVDPIIARLEAVSGLETAQCAEDLAALIATQRLPERVPAAFVLATDEGGRQAERTIHRTLFTTIMTVVLVTKPVNRESAARPLAGLGPATIEALDGVVPAQGWSALGYVGGRRQVRAAGPRVEGGVFLTLHFETTTTRRA